jgi:hypothetical protein
VTPVLEELTEQRNILRIRAFAHSRYVKHAGNEHFSEIDAERVRRDPTELLALHQKKKLSSTQSPIYTTYANYTQSSTKPLVKSLDIRHPTQSAPSRPLDTLR